MSSIGIGIPNRNRIRIRIVRARPLPRVHGGFTLIELMIAIVVMAVLSLLAWRGLDSMSRTNARLEERSAQSEQLTRTLQQLERDLAWRTTVELPVARLEQARPGPRPGPGLAPTLVPLLPPGMAVRRATQPPFVIELVRAAPAEPGRWQRVQWWQQAGTLYRAAGAAAAAYPLPAPRSDDRVAVLEDIAAFDVRAWEPGQGWQRLPVAAPVRTPASGLEITLAVRRGNGPLLQYRQAIALR